MRLVQMLLAIIGFAALTAPASAQIYWSAPDFSGAPLLSLEPGYGTPLPGASPFEQEAAILWNFRSGLNLAALQCGFEPMLRTEQNYNAMLSDHRDELGSAYTTLSAYFKRTTKTPAAAQKALDTYGTRTISSFSTVQGQLGFCHTAGHVGRAALFTPRGSLKLTATARVRELYNAQRYQPEQQFRSVRPIVGPMPRLEDSCWDRKGRYKANCGVI
jgi:hypothetical protein